jgi:hypothetical protein
MLSGLRHSAARIVACAGAAAVLAAGAAAAPGRPTQPLIAGPYLVSETGAADHVFVFDLGATGDPISSPPQPRTLMLRPGGAGPADEMRVWETTAEGCALVFTGRARTAEGGPGGVTRAYTAALDGSGVRELVPGLSAAVSLWEPAVQPGGGRVAFTVTERIGQAVALNTDAAANFTHHIAVYDPAAPTADNPDGPFRRYSVSGDEHTPRWSPDGARLAYTAYTRGDDGSRTSDVWLTDADGLNRAPLTDFPTGNIVSPRWSPDGDLIAFVYSPDGLRDQYWVIGAQPGAIPTQLSYADLLALDFTWQPGGAALLAAAQDVRGIAAMGLWRVPLVGSLDADGAPAFDTLGLRGLRSARYSADGRWLAARTEYSLVLIEVATGRHVRLNAPLANTAPVWSPAGFAGESACGP